MSSKVEIQNIFDAANRKSRTLLPAGYKRVSNVRLGDVRGKRFSFKYPPPNILQVANDFMGYTMLSDRQKKVLVDLMGDDPEVWPTDWNEAVLAIGQRGGKNTVMEVLTIYVLQLLVNLVDPYGFLGHFAGKQLLKVRDVDITNNSMVGECVPLDSEILTKEGWKTYDNVKVGEEVMVVNLLTSSIEFNQILKINQFENLETSWLLFDNGESVRCTENHKWLVYDPGMENISLLETSKLTPEHRIIIDPFYESECHLVKKQPGGIMDVWCPTTESGTWVMRQNGFKIFTGNSQAKDVFFGRIKAALRSTIEPGTGENIFLKYIGLNLKEDGLGDIKSKIIEFPKFGENTGGIKLYSLDSGISTFEGKDILISMVDEPSRATTLATFQNAKILWDGLTANTSLTYPNMVGKCIAFSYFNTSEYDLTYTLIEEEEKSIRKHQEEQANVEKPEPYTTNRKIYVISTFEFNPSKKRTDQDIKKRYESNPEDAMARYECKKSKTKYAFFKPHIEKIRECVIHIPNTVTYTAKQTEKMMKNGVLRKYTALELFDIKGDNRYRIWAMDTSINKDRFVLASAYSENVELNLNSYMDDEKDIPIGSRVVMDTLLVWYPSKSYPIDYGNVEEAIKLLLDKFPNSIKFIGDKYQTEGFASIFAGYGVEPDTLTFSNKSQFEFYSLLRTAVFNGMVSYLSNELLLTELEHIQKVNETKVDHPLGGSKDVADCLALLYKSCCEISMSQLNKTGSLDRYSDQMLIEQLDKMIKIENEAALKQYNVKDYVCEMMRLSESDYEKLKNLREVFFPG